MKNEFNNCELQNQLNEIKETVTERTKILDKISSDIKNIENNLSRCLIDDLEFKVQDERLKDYEPVLVYAKKRILLIYQDLKGNSICKPLLETKAMFREVIYDNLLDFLKEMKNKNEFKKGERK
jgi:hypothetical protein